MDELLGLKPSAAEAPSSTAELHLWRKFRDVQNLPERKRRAVLRMVDEFLDGYGKKTA
jgi:hypothetical protein